MTTVSVSEQYAIELPEEVRKRAKIEPGQTLLVFVRNGVVSLVPDLPIEALRGMFPDLDTTDYREKQDRM